MSSEPTTPAEEPALLNLDEHRFAKAATGIRDGDVLAFQRRGFWSALIRKWTDSRISHVGFAVFLAGRLCVIEAQEGRGVQVVPLRIYLQDSSVQVTWYRLLAKEHDLDRAKLIDRALSKWGCRYASPRQFLRSFVLSKELGDWLGLPDNLDETRFFCSDIVLDTLRFLGYRGNPELKAIRTSPGDIVEGLDCVQRMFRVA